MAGDIAMTSHPSPTVAATAPVRSSNAPPPGPKGLPLLGNSLQFARDQLGFLTRTSRDFGDIAAFDMAGWPSLLLSDSDDIEQVLVRNHRNFVKNRLVWRHFTAVFGHGILTSEGDFWHRNRRLA